MRCPACGNENRAEARFCDSCGAVLETAADAASPPPASAAEPLPGAVGEGRYEIVEFLGRGGRKRVYLARDRQQERDVAIALFEMAGMDEAVLARARREAQAMRRLGECPQIVTVYDSGEEDGAPYIVSEYMPGGDVAGALDAAPGRRLQIERALEVADGVGQALEHAHARGIVHRDIKPANVWLAEDGSARLGDFGLATTGGRSRGAMEGMLVGTVAYLPPEQALGRAADPRSDLYSLGALLYEMLTGQPPFPGDDAVAIIGQHLNAAPVAPSQIVDSIPPALDALVLALLAKRPEDRPQDAAEFRRLLAEARDAPASEPSGAEEPAENPLDRLAGGVFVGRDRELTELRGAVDDALAGRGRLLMLVGEPGIGKTRSAEELATYARVNGAKVYWGRCLEDDAAPAYFPWSRAIRDYVREADPVALAWEMGSGAAEIARIVPEVAERVSDLQPAAEADSEQARFRLFDAIATFLTGASRDRPLVLILDDLHWADEPTLLLLKFLARQLADSGLLIVATYRDVELGRHHPLAGALGELAEHGTRITLRGLDAAGVARYMEMVAGVEPDPQLAATVHAQTEGNPFFVSEIVRLLASEGKLAAGAGDAAISIPQGVREVIGRRLDRLSPEANQVLRVGAACGRRFRRDVVEEVACCGDAAALLDEAVAARLLEHSEQAGNAYVFSHALVRETLYEEIPSSQRVELHGRIGAALEKVYATGIEEHLDELARHFLEAAPAGETAKAVDYATRAGRRAFCDLAYEEAAEDFDRALAVVSMQPEADPRRRCELLLAVGEAQTRAGRFGAARTVLDEAAELATELEEPSMLVKAALGISALFEVGIVDERIIELLERALAAIGEEDSSQRALLLSALAQQNYWIDPAGRAQQLSQQAVEMARRLDDPRTLAAALGRHYFSAVGPTGTEQQIAITNEMLELAARGGDRELAMTAHVYRLRSLLELGDIAGVDRELEAYTRIAEELRQPNHLWHIPVLRAMRALMDGRFAEAAGLAEEARAGGERAEEPLAAQFFAIQMALVARYLGELDPIAERVKEFAERYPAIRAWRCALAAVYSEAGRVDEARAELERLGADDFEGIPFDAQWIGSISLAAEAAANLRDARRSAQLYEILLPYDGLVVVAGRGAACYGPVSRYLGRLADTMGRGADAVRHMEAALATATSMGDRPVAAMLRYETATMLVARGRSGDPERALQLVSAALDSAQELGMKRLVEQALALKLELQGLGSIDVTTSIDAMVSVVQSERPDLAAHAAPDGSVTILFSDIENSTLMTERLGDERWLDVLRAHNEVFRQHLRARGGFEVKSQGDGFMITFPSPREALECAIGVQREFAARAEEASEDAVRIRMGLHAGEVIREEGDFFGKNVILAARIAAQAQGGEILVSSTLKERAEDETNGNGGLSFDAGRELELKGLAGMHRVYRAEWQGDAAVAGL
ncbi:MAG: eukaryotic-like serine/threonine-protein kinase [Solirubrobacterales bacterium]|nr:eukaryotic-like serine/threonine-protein kinase [Solirubrobacterales bacterium]